MRLLAPSASPEEAAAIVSAVERFRRATVPAPTGGGETVDRWRTAALFEGISQQPNIDAPSPWINT